MYQGKFFEYFGDLDDCREEGKVWYKLSDIVFITVTGVICGLDEWDKIHIWASKEATIKWLTQYIELRHGVPSLSTLRRVFAIIDPDQFAERFSDWMHELVSLEERDIVSVDGKTMCGSQEKIKGTKGIHIVSALCQSHNLVMGELATEEKSNEITAIPELLDILYLKGCIVTIDAMGTQRKIVEKIKEKGADYVLSLKGNQETIHHEVEDYFEDLEEDDALPQVEENTEAQAEADGVEVLQTMDRGHGRTEMRTYYYSTDIGWMIDAKKDWIDLTGIGMVDRKVERDGEISIERHYYLGSIDNVKEFAGAVRQHWGVESMHWSLDITFREDDNTTKNRNAAKNMAVLKRMALNIVRRDTTCHPDSSLRSKRFQALLDTDYRDHLLEINFNDQDIE